jgi:hypothetical protein
LSREKSLRLENPTSWCLALMWWEFFVTGLNKNCLWCSSFEAFKFKT